MIKRKSVVTEQHDKLKQPRKKKLKIDMSSLPDAIVSGKFIASIGDRVFFERKLNNVTKVHEGTVKGVNEEKGIVELFDDTVEQFYYFSLHQTLPVIKKAI